MKKQTQARVKDTLTKFGMIALSGIAYGVYAYLGNITMRPETSYESENDSYGLAARAISKSSMWSSDKAEALKVLLNYGTEGYYQSIVSIVNSSMWSSDKLAAIKRESAKFSKTMYV